MTDQSLSALMADMKISTKIEHDAIKMLKQENVEPHVPMMASRIGDTPRGEISLTTNVYGVIMDETMVYRYDVNILGYYAKRDGLEKFDNLTTKISGDAICVERRTLCRDLFLTFKQINLEFLKGGDKCVYYDLQSILFSLIQFDLDMSGISTFVIDTKQLPTSCSNYSRCEIKISKVNMSFELQLGKFGHISLDLNLAEHSLSQFIDIATSQAVFFNDKEHITFSSGSSYLLEPGIFNLSDTLPYFEDTDSYLSYGAQKSVRFIEGPRANGCAASIVVETKKTAFHSVALLSDKAKCIVRNLDQVNEDDIIKLNKFFKKLYVETNHSKRRQQFFVKSIADQTSKTKNLSIDGKDVTVEQYFLKRYNIKLQYPNAPLVATAGRDGVRYYPIELCYVCDNQRVKMEQQTSLMTQKTIKQCAIAPLLLREQNQKTAQSLHLWDSEYLKNAHIQIVKKPVYVNARSIVPPDMEFGRGAQVALNKSNFTWQGREYLAPVQCNVWAAYAFLEVWDKLSVEDFQEFLRRFMAEAQAHGIKIDYPQDFAVKDSNSNTIREAFSLAAKNDCEYVFVVHSDTGDDAHADVKYSEREFSLVSQAVRLGTLRNVLTKNQRLTMTNIVNKTNIKLGGLNYNISRASSNSKYILGMETLYIGFGANHPSGGLGIKNTPIDSGSADMTKDLFESSASLMVDSPPSVIGYSANIGNNGPFDFVGDFEPLRDEKINIIQMIIERCIDQFLIVRNNNVPKRIIIYRNGCSEGQFRHVIMYEVPLIKIALAKLNCSNTLLTIIVANKLQNIRFFNEHINVNDKVPDQNVRPGTVIDHTVVHPVFAEFFLSSHRAIQGTARTPKYTVLYDENKMPISQVESITFHLCFGHQIIFSPVSLPSPIYIANRYAERGRMLYQRYIAHEGCREITYMDLTKRLAFYESSSLFGRRVNA